MHANPTGLDHPDGPREGAPRPWRVSPWRYWPGCLATLAVCVLAMDRPLWQPHRFLRHEENVQIGEAAAMCRGRLDLPERRWDTAVRDGRIYSYFPPMFSFLAAGQVALWGGVPHLFFVALAAVLILLSYALFVRLAGSLLWGTLLTLGFIMGTSHWPVLERMLRGGTPYSTNHVLATIGLLPVLLLFARGRGLAAACTGLAVAALSRQMTIAFALPLGFWAWRRWADGHGVKAMVFVATSCFVALTITCTMNALKFGSPWDSGYLHNYESRDDAFARDAMEHGLFAAHYVPRNLYYSNVGFPHLHRIEAGGQKAWYLRSDDMGAGIWWTTPVLLWLFALGRSLRGDGLRIVLLGAGLSIYVALLFWHGTGSVQRGFNRYSLDYVPSFFAVVAPWCVATPRRRWLTLGMVSWSILYFAVLLPRPNIRIW